MTKADARRERFEQVEVLGKNVLFTELRVDRDTVPEGLRCYELRHTDEDWGEPCELARGIMVNFMGTILWKLFRRYKQIIKNPVFPSISAVTL